MFLRNIFLSRVAASAFFRAVVLALTGASFVRADIKTGNPFPELAPAGVVSLAGGELPATEGKVILVDFWASWCAPCKASFPAMARLHADYAARGLVIAAVSIDEKPAAATAFWKKMAPPFPTLHDRQQNLVKQVGVPTMPTSYLVGRDGRVRFVHEGFHGDATDRELRKEIDALLAEKNNPYENTPDRPLSSRGHRLFVFRLRQHEPRPREAVGTRGAGRLHDAV